MGVPRFLLRKLYRRGSLRETGDGRFAFALHNRLATATLIAPPQFVVNGVSVQADRVGLDEDGDAISDVDLEMVTPEEPYAFRKGRHIDLHFPGRLLRGGNRIHVHVTTKEFGELDFLVEDKERESCDLSEE